MKGKTVVITGATSGIGQVAAARLAEMGARVVLIARDKDRAAVSLQQLREINSGAAHSVHYADLSRLAEVRRVAAEIAAAEPRIDVLMNNAGAMFQRRQVTEDGLELTFATNHMSYFVLTQGLRDRLLQSAPARIINTASGAHRGAKLDFNDLQSARDYSGFKVYSRSKLANILFTRKLAKDLEGTGVTANSLHPGFVATRFADQSGGSLSQMFRFFKLFALSPENGAKTLVYLASSDEVANTTGQYFLKCRPAQPSPEAHDDAAAARLWEASEELARKG